MSPFLFRWEEKSPNFLSREGREGFCHTTEGERKKKEKKSISIKTDNSANQEGKEKGGIKASPLNGGRKRGHEDSLLLPRGRKKKREGGGSLRSFYQKKNEEGKKEKKKRAIRKARLSIKCSSPEKGEKQKKEDLVKTSQCAEEEGK